MRSSKLIELIKVLNKKELKQLDAFLRSPFFVEEKVSKRICPLFEYLYALFPDFDDAVLDKISVYKKIFPNEEYIKGKLEKIMTLLFQTTKRFVVENYAQKNKKAIHDELKLAGFYRERKMDRSFQLTLKQIRKSQNSVKQKDKDYFFNEFLIAKEYAEYESFYNTRQKDLNLPSTLKNLDIFYILSKQEYSSRLLSQDKHQMPLEVDENLIDLKDFLTLLKKKKYFDVPLIKIYDLALRLLQNTDGKDAVKELNCLLEKYKNDIPLEQLKAMQTLCRNYSVQFYNEGNREYLQLSFDLYKKHLEEGFLYYNDGLLPSTIKNIVVLGLKLKEIDWVYNFLEKYKNKVVGTKHNKEVYHFNLASYYFAKKSYNEALRYLSETYEDWYYQIAARRLEIKIYYETKSVLLDPKLDAFKIYIFRISKSKLTKLQKLGNNHFADVVRQINSPKTTGNSDRIERLATRVKNKKVIAEEEWLLEKLKDLI